MSHELAEHIDQSEANEQILRQSELGIILADAYIAATNIDPRLENIAVLPIEDPTISSFAFARAAWMDKNQTGKHEVYVRLNDLDHTLSLFDNLMKHTPKMTAVVAESLGLQSSEVTPQLMFVYSTLHEMGHTLEYMDYEAAGKTPAEHKHDSSLEREKLPIGNLLASHLLSDNHPNRAYVIQNWDAVREAASKNYSDYIGTQSSISTMEELIDATAHVHRISKFEAAADRFAATVLQTQPLMVEQLTGDITRFRNYPQHAGEGIAV